MRSQDNHENAELLLDGHFVINPSDTFHRIRHFHCFLYLGRIVDEAAQHDFTLLRFDTDIRTLDIGIPQQSSLHFGGDDAVINRGSSR